MGSCVSSPEDSEARARTAAIDRQMREEAKAQEKAFKLLLLGAGESGKSTVLKQFKLIHGVPFTETERLSYRPAILGNLMSSARALIGAMGKLGIAYSDPSSAAKAATIMASPPSFGEGEKVPAHVLAALKGLWKDEGIKACFARSSEFQLIDSCEYYMNQVERVCQDNYVPDDNDILHARVMTTTITENRFLINGITFRIFDVGGQRSERKKWAPYFDDVHSIIFLAAISAYDQKCFEDDTTNRMLESLNLFDSICNHPLFRKTSIILFLNKIDLFKYKIKRIPVKDHFPEYTGPEKFEAASEFFAHKFVQLNRTPDKKMYIHFTWATDTSQIKTVFATVNAIILRDNLNASGL
ncbi:guanine nucleotide-binding protein subunit alpha [Gaertneriomyces sp. JEL0708]|nr:guanine nucleotide-binding protein subunit alpha [Gaertneriomyces sp. JEL0708]